MDFFDESDSQFMVCELDYWNKICGFPHNFPRHKPYFKNEKSEVPKSLKQYLKPRYRQKHV